MAQPYLIAMEHAEFHARDIIRKHQKNRPLGHIERHHRFTPPQPVLSCRSVNVDVSGTRTYRAMSASDIIDEQHKLIHNVYAKARNINSAPTKRSRVLSTDPPGSRALKHLQVQGSGRPNTSTGFRPASTRRTLQIGLKRRPQTAGTPRQGKPGNDCFLKVKVDKEYVLVSEAFTSVNGQVRDQWANPEHHRLDEGIFVRGKKQSGANSLDPRTGNQWLTFAGGQRVATAGVVDAFTAMKDTEEYYTIDGSTGSLVAKALKPGDKIRVGVNGESRGQDGNVNKWFKHQQDKMARLGDDSKAKPQEIVPLCWTDQVTKNDVKVLAASSPREETPRHNMCETRPVVFRKLIPEDELNQMRPQTAGYTMKLRHKPRKGMDGVERESSRITSISLAKEDEDEEEEDNQVTYDDILKMKMKAGSRPSTRESKRKSKSRSRSNSPKSARGKNKGTSVETGTEPNSIMTNGNGSQSNMNNKQTSGSTQTPSVRPVTSLSVMSQDYDLDSMVNVVSVGPRSAVRGHGGRSVGTVPASREGPGPTPATPKRILSAGRPPPARSSLHKTAAAGGASIRSDTGSENTEFIQIASQISVNKEKPGPGSAHSPRAPASPAPGSAAIEHVHEHNKTKYEGSIITERMVNLEDTVVAPASPPLPPRGTPEPPPEEETATERPVTASPVPVPRSPDIKFAFNIPTAEYIDSEANSMVGENENVAPLETVEENAS